MYRDCPHVLLVENMHEAADRFRRFLRHNGVYVDFAKPDSVDPSRYIAADCVVEDITTRSPRRKPEILIRLRKNYPGIPVIIASLECVRRTRAEPHIDSDGILYFPEGLTENDLLIAIQKVSKKHARYPR